MKPTILLIEDNEQNLYLATFLLEQNGCKVVPARSGPEGIEPASRIEPPSLFSRSSCRRWTVTLWRES